MVGAALRVDRHEQGCVHGGEGSDGCRERREYAHTHAPWEVTGRLRQVALAAVQSAER